MLTRDNKIKCDTCGKFLSYADLNNGVSRHEYKLDMQGNEYYETDCGEHTEEPTMTDLTGALARIEAALELAQNRIIYLSAKCNDRDWRHDDTVVIPAIKARIDDCQAIREAVPEHLGKSIRTITMEEKYMRSIHQSAAQILHQITTEQKDG